MWRYVPVIPELGDRRIKSSRSSRFHDPKKESFSIVPTNIQIFNLTASDGSCVQEDMMLISQTQVSLLAGVLRFRDHTT